MLHSPSPLQGFLLNFCNDNAEATERCGELGFVGVVASNVLSTRTNDAVFNATLNLLVAVAEAPESAGRDGGSLFSRVCLPRNRLRSYNFIISSLVNFLTDFSMGLIYVFLICGQISWI